MTQKIDPCAQINALRYVTQVREQAIADGEDPKELSSVQQLLDTFIGMVVVYDNAPRIYEVTEDGQHVRFVTRTFAEWDEMLRQADRLDKMDKIFDKLVSVLGR